MSDRSTHAAAYDTQEVAHMLGLPASRIRAYVRAGYLEPRRGPGGELRFSFLDLVFLRRVKGLGAARIAPRRVRRALEHLKQALPEDRPLSGVELAAAGGLIVVREGERLWSPESGQCVFDFEAAGGERAVVAFTPAARSERVPNPRRDLEVEDWYLLGCELEDTDADRAAEAYRRALALDPSHPESRVNLGRLYHEAGKLDDAEAHYRAGLAASPEDATAAFNLAVVLDDLGRDREACEAYGNALRLDPDCADAHYNLARLCDRLGDAAGLVRHLRAYRRLIETSD